MSGLILIYMDRIKGDILLILRGAENELKKLIVRAAESGEYRYIDMARSAAEEIRKLLEKVSKPSYGRRRSSGRSRRRRLKSSTFVGGLERSYPLFELWKDNVVKIGWSGKLKKQYVHKIPKTTFRNSIAAMSKLGSRGAGPFSTEEIIAKARAHCSNYVPAYQVYIVLGLLRQKGCIRRAGKDGYKIPSDLSGRVDRVWMEMGGRPAYE